VRDAETLAKAVQIEVERGKEAVAITLKAGIVGHSVPTGDLFRRLVVRAFLVPDANHEEPLGRPVVMARSFVDVPVHPDSPRDPSLQRREGPDTRLAPPGRPGSERRVELALTPSERASGVRWEVVYQRMPDRVAASFGVSQAEDELVFGHGFLPARDRVRDR
jgi:hypothetical protein